MKIFDLHFVPDWREFYRWYSVHWTVLEVALFASWAKIPDDIRTAIPGWALAGLAAFLLAGGILSRLWGQEKRDV